MVISTRNRIDGRFFIIGSARSGTTLLQAMLASNSVVYSFPESHFFCEAAPRGRFRRRLGVVRKELARAAFGNLTRVIERADLLDAAPSRSPLMRSYSNAFVRVVDAAALDEGKRVWVEKTPHHIDFVNLISRQVKRSRFIHILRDGRDVVASQLHATIQAPEYWGNWAVKDLVDQWNSDTLVSLRYVGSENHLLVSYRALIDDPERVLRHITTFMDITFEEAMLRHWESADKILGSRSSEPWMQTTFQPIEDRRLKKFATVLSNDERDYVIRNLRWGGDVDQHFEAAGATTPHSYT